MVFTTETSVLAMSATEIPIELELVMLVLCINTNVLNSIVSNLAC